MARTYTDYKGKRVSIKSSVPGGGTSLNLRTGILWMDARFQDNVLKVANL